MANGTNKRIKRAEGNTTDVRVDLRGRSEPGVPSENIIDLKRLVAQRERPSGTATDEGNSVAPPRQPLLTKLPTVRETIRPHGRVGPATRPKLNVPREPLPEGWRRSVASFAAAGVLVLLPVFALSGVEQLTRAKGRVLGISTDAYHQLTDAQAAVGSGDFAAAKDRFTKAGEAFIAAEQELERTGPLLTLLQFVPGRGRTVVSGRSLLAAGEELASAGRAIAGVVETINHTGADGATRLTEVLQALSGELSPARDSLERANAHLERVEILDVPADQRDAVAGLKEQLPVIVSDFSSFIEYGNTLSNVLGAQGTRRYLVLFQNNMELRATGGFVGSFALVDISDGRVQAIDVPAGGSYDVQGQLTEQVVSPAPLHLVNPHWQLQDANWFPDFPTSAEKVLWFYEKSGGPTVDGVIAIDTTFVEDILKLIGGIDLTDSRGVVISSENFAAETLRQVEADTPSGRPKEFIAELVPVLLERLFTVEGDAFVPLFDMITRSFAERHLLVYVTDPDLRRTLDRYGWTGQMIQTDGDYLAVVDSNIAGGKTDRAIEEIIRHRVAIGSDGSLIATVTVTRIHKGTPGDGVTGVKNIDYVRLYVPDGATFISAGGWSEIDEKLFRGPAAGYQPDADLAAIEGRPTIDEPSGTRITREFGKTVFGNWLSVEAGTSATASVTYRLPFLLEPTADRPASYSLFVQKQAGTDGHHFDSQVSLPQQSEAIWSWPADGALTFDNGTASFAGVLEKDNFFTFALTRK